MRVHGHPDDLSPDQLRWLLADGRCPSCGQEGQLTLDNTDQNVICRYCEASWIIGRTGALYFRGDEDRRAFLPLFEIEANLAYKNLLAEKLSRWSAVSRVIVPLNTSSPRRSSSSESQPPESPRAAA